MGHVIGDVITDAATVDVAVGVLVDIPVGVLAGLAVGVMVGVTVDAVARVVVDVVYTARITLLTSVLVHTVGDIDPHEPWNT